MVYKLDKVQALLYTINWYTLQQLKWITTCSMFCRTSASNWAVLAASTSVKQSTSNTRASSTDDWTSPCSFTAHLMTTVTQYTYKVNNNINTMKYILPVYMYKSVLHVTCSQQLAQWPATPSQTVHVTHCCPLIVSFPSSKHFCSQTSSCVLSTLQIFCRRATQIYVFLTYLFSEQLSILHLKQ